MPREGGLGKGLSSLIPQRKTASSSSASQENKKNSDFVSREFDSEVVAKKSPAKKSENKKNQKEVKSKSKSEAVLDVDVKEIVANPFQPRKHFDENKLEELASSIKKHGVIQPLVVTKRPEGGFELVAGERRFKASQKNGLSKVPVVVKKISDKEKMEWALIENIQRDDLNAIEEAEAYQRLAEKLGYTQLEIAEQVGKSRSAVSNTLRLLELSSDLKQKVKEGFLSEGHARALLAVADEDKRNLLANQIIDKKLSVREAEKKVKKILSPSSDKKESGAGFEVLEFENKISQALGTKVKIKKGRKGGSFILNYYSEEEFSNLINKLTS